MILLFYYQAHSLKRPCLSVIYLVILPNLAQQKLECVLGYSLKLDTQNAYFVKQRVK